MAVSETGGARPSWLRTLAAVVLGFATYNVAALLIAISFYYLGSIFKFGAIEIVGTIFGGVIGIILAKIVCETFVHIYSAKTILIFFCVFGFLGLSAHAVLLLGSGWETVRAELDSDRFRNIIQNMVAIVASITVFWERKSSWPPGGRGQIRKFLEFVLFGLVSIVYSVVTIGIFVGWAYWLFVSVKVGSFVMFIFGILGPCAIPASLLGLWSFLFGAPDWLLHFVARL